MKKAFRFISNTMPEIDLLGEWSWFPQGLLHTPWQVGIRTPMVNGGGGNPHLKTLHTLSYRDKNPKIQNSKNDQK